MLRMLASKWEVLLLVAILIVIVSGVGTPGFLTAPNLATALAAAMPIAIMTLGMTLVIIAGDIDLSVASILALSACVFGWALTTGMPLIPAMLLMLLVGAICGAFNAVLVVLLGLPSLVVTLGTMTLFRGLGFALLADGPVSTFPAEFLAFANGRVEGFLISWPFLLFLVLSVLFALLLQRGRVGRQIYAIGGNSLAADFSGVPTRRVRFSLFVVSGLMAAIAGLVLVSFLSSARAELARGLELDVIAIVLLGGVSIFGGVGRITGVALGLTLYILLTNWLSLQNVTADDQQIVIGGLLIAAVIISNVLRAVGGRSDSRGAGLVGLRLSYRSEPTPSEAVSTASATKKERQ